MAEPGRDGKRERERGALRTNYAKSRRKVVTHVPTLQSDITTGACAPAVNILRKAGHAG